MTDKVRIASYNIGAGVLARIRRFITNHYIYAAKELSADLDLILSLEPFPPDHFAPMTPELRKAGEALRQAVWKNNRSDSDWLDKRRLASDQWDAAILAASKAEPSPAELSEKEDQYPHWYRDASFGKELNRLFRHDSDKTGVAIFISGPDAGKEYHLFTSGETETKTYGPRITADEAAALLRPKPEPETCKDCGHPMKFHSLSGCYDFQGVLICLCKVPGAASIDEAYNSAYAAANDRDIADMKAKKTTKTPPTPPAGYGNVRMESLTMPENGDESKWWDVKHNHWVRIQEGGMRDVWVCSPIPPDDFSKKPSFLPRDFNLTPLRPDDEILIQ